MFEVVKGTAGLPTDTNGWNRITQSCFIGKGDPEYCQTVLQLARHWKLHEKYGGLQRYADACMGLDCNGFVGNYLWHVKDKAPWSSHGLDCAQGPNSTINVYFDRLYAVAGTYIAKWEELERSETYIFGKTTPNGAIIPAYAGGEYAHIVITQSGFIDNVLLRGYVGGRCPRATVIVCGSKGRAVRRTVVLVSSGYSFDRYESVQTAECIGDAKGSTRLTSCKTR